MTTLLAAASPAEPEQPAPVAAAKRIDSLDVLRGFAVLGILVMNIQSFGLPMAAYMNPTVAGGFEGANYWIWVVGHLLADLKFMSIFSMLFGAGIVLFTSRIEARGASACALHYRRMGWLLLIGVTHGYLLWVGDILFMYALSGMLLYWARRWRPRTLVVVGGASLLVTTALTGLFALQFIVLQNALDRHDRQASLVAPAEAEQASPEGAEAPAETSGSAAAAGVVPTPSDPEGAELFKGLNVAEARAAIEEMRASYDPPPEMIEKETAAMTGDYLDEVGFRAPQVVTMQTFLVLFYGWRVFAMMLLGMALFKWGVLSAARSMKVYAAMAAIGFAVGLPIIWIGLQRDLSVDFHFLQAKFVNSHFNYFGSVFVALGWIGAIMLLCRAGAIAWLTTSLAAVGRMAFTNYLMHTIICTTIFNGRSGLGLAKFGELDRAQLLAIVAGIFVAQMIVSPLWLSAFRFGPFESLWRSLTYWRLQPMRR